MKLRHNFITGVQSLKSNTPRASLTILGIVIGIASIILIVSIGQSAKNLIVEQVEGLGSNTLVIIPGREPSGMSDISQIFSDSLKVKDFESLFKNIPSQFIERASPIMFGAESASYENETYRFTLLGTSEAIIEIFDIFPEYGNFFSTEDIRALNDVIVIGSKVKQELFGSLDALGKKIRIKNKNYKVIGVLPKKGQIAVFNFDEVAMVPYTTAQKYIFGISYLHRIIAQTKQGVDIREALNEIKITLRNNHNITDPEKDDFFIQTQADIIDRLDIITSVLTLFLVSVAAISLIVGGIGIMNIMLISVTERTREIGLRKALGATQNNILTQFLFEAIVLTGTGGIIGIILGAILSMLASIVISSFMTLKMEFYFPAFSAILGFGVSTLIGLCFGIYPARQASLKSPVEALRYE